MNILQIIETISIHNADGALISSFPDTQDNSQGTNYVPEEECTLEELITAFGSNMEHFVKG